MIHFVFFSLFCISAYFAGVFSSLWWVGFTLILLYMWAETWMNENKIKTLEKEKARILDPSLIEIDREEAEKKEKRFIFIWNSFGWIVLIGLAFISKEWFFLFFLFGSYFFSWGDFMCKPIKDFF